MSAQPRGGRAARRWLAGLGAPLLLLPLAAVLSGRAEGLATTPLVVAPESWDRVPVAIPGAAYVGLDGQQIVHRLRLATRDVGSLAGHQQIRLLVATHGTFPKLMSGDLAIRGTSCIYRTVRGTAFADNTALAFLRGPGCTPLQGLPTGEVDLTIRFSVGGQVALWTYVPPADADVGGSLVVADPAAPESPARPLVRGVGADTFPASSARRLALLAYVWQVSPGGLWIVWTLGACALLLPCGLYLLLPAGAGPGDEGTGFRRALRHAAGGFCMAAAMAASWAVIVPPFQAADEPNHFIGFAAFTGRPGTDVEAANWARLMHFERIQFHPEERFGPSDRGVPGLPWNDGGEPDRATRGAGVEALWRTVSPFVRDLPAAQLLLALRLVNVGLFAAGVAAYFLFVGLFAGLRWPQMAAVPLFLIPTLPFFGMQVSNYALLVAAYLVLGSGVVILPGGGPASSAAGVLIGAGWGGALLISRSAIPLAPFIGAILLARLVPASRARSLGEGLVFWLGFAGSMAAGLALADASYLRYVAAVTAGPLPPGLSRLPGIVLTHPSVLLLAGLAAAGLERGIDRVTRGWRARVRPGLERLVRRGAPAAAVAALVVMAGPLAVRYPTLPPLDQSHLPSAADYAQRAVLAGLTLFRAAQPDYLTSVTFWGGFGWLDTLLPDRLVSLLAAASGLAAVALLLWIARTGAVRTAVAIALAAAGATASLAAYALSVILLTPADLHGRYVLGLYLCVLLLAWSGVPRAAEAGWLRSPLAAAAAAMLGPAAVHGFALAFVTLRYF